MPFRVSEKTGGVVADGLLFSFAHVLFSEVDEGAIVVSERTVGAEDAELMYLFLSLGKAEGALRVSGQTVGVEVAAARPGSPSGSQNRLGVTGWSFVVRVPPGPFLRGG